MSTFTFGWILLIIAALGWDMGARAMPLVVALLGILSILSAISPAKP